MSWYEMFKVIVCKRKWLGVLIMGFIEIVLFEEKKFEDDCLIIVVVVVVSFCIFL